MCVCASAEERKREGARGKRNRRQASAEGRMKRKRWERTKVYIKKYGNQLRLSKPSTRNKLNTFGF